VQSLLNCEVAGKGIGTAPVSAYVETWRIAGLEWISRSVQIRARNESRTKGGSEVKQPQIHDVRAILKAEGDTVIKVARNVKGSVSRSVVIVEARAHPISRLALHDQ